MFYPEIEIMREAYREQKSRGKLKHRSNQYQTTLTPTINLNWISTTLVGCGQFTPRIGEEGEDTWLQACPRK